jgi:hypothetical protein
MSKPDPKANQEAAHPVATIEIPPPDNPPDATTPFPPEFGGRKGPEATRYGDWEMDGKCVDF